jgi:hypothetical protein
MSRPPIQGRAGGASLVPQLLQAMPKVVGADRNFVREQVLDILAKDID